MSIASPPNRRIYPVFTNMLIHRTTPLPPVNISENEENVVGSQYCKNVKYIYETVSTSFSFL